MSATEIQKPETDADYDALIQLLDESIERIEQATRDRQAGLLSDSQAVSIAKSERRLHDAVERVLP